MGSLGGRRIGGCLPEQQQVRAGLINTVFTIGHEGIARANRRFVVTVELRDA